MRESTGKRLTEDESLKRIQERCIESDIEFLGFDNEENKYKNDVTKLVLKCNKCGHVWNTNTYAKFVRAKRNCPNCSKSKRKTEEEIIEDINRICKEKDYAFLGFNSGFKGIKTKLILKCNKCNRKWNTTTYVNLKQIGRNSHTCKRNNAKQISVKFNVDNVINTLNEKLKDTSLEFVSFDEKGYIGTRSTHVMLRCKECGKINTFAYNYILSVNFNIKCKCCEFGGKFSHDEATKIVTDKCKKLNYTFLGFNTEDKRYDGKNTYLTLKCNKCGKVWKTTNFVGFKNTTIKCPGCINSWKMEKEIESLLRSNNIEYIEQCRKHNLPWLKNKASLSLDFFLPKFNIAIECQGKQHFEPVLDFGGEKTYKESILRDEKKLSLCKENGIKLLYYDSENGHTEFLGEKVYNNEKEILTEIIKHGKEN